MLIPVRSVVTWFPRKPSRVTRMNAITGGSRRSKHTKPMAITPMICVAYHLPKRSISKSALANCKKIKNGNAPIQKTWSRVVRMNPTWAPISKLNHAMPIENNRDSTMYTIALVFSPSITTLTLTMSA